MILFCHILLSSSPDPSVHPSVHPPTHTPLKAFASHQGTGMVMLSAILHTVSRSVPKLNAFSLPIRCQNILALPKGFGVQEVKLQQSTLLFEQSRCAVQAKRADGPGRLVPCGAGKGSRFSLPWRNLSPDSRVVWEGLHPPSLGRCFTIQMVNSVSFGDTCTGSSSCSV